MEMFFASSGINEYLNVTIKMDANEKVKKIAYQIDMLQGNTVPNILGSTVAWLDTEITIKYNVNSLHVLDQVIEKTKPDGKFLSNIISQLSKCLINIEDYLLDSGNIVLDSEYVFYNQATKEVKFIYVPGHDENIKIQLKRFLETIMKIFNHKDLSGVEYMYNLYEIVCRDDFCVEDLFEVAPSFATAPSGNRDNLSKLTQKNILIQNQETALSGSREIAPKPTQKNPTKDLEKNPKKNSPKKPSKNPSKNKVEGKYIWIIVNLFLLAFTGIFYFALECPPVLIYICLILTIMIIIQFLATLRKKETVDEIMRGYKESINTHKLVPLTSADLKPIILDKKCIKVGRGKEETDYRILSTEISRLHASVYDRGEFVYVEDKSSTNGTFINGNRISANEMMEIHIGDIIAFGKEEFFLK